MLICVRFLGKLPGWPLRARHPMTNVPNTRYDRARSYDWNYEHAPDVPPVALQPPLGDWSFCGLPVGSPLGIPAGPLLNGRWCLYYAALGFDVLTYKTVRSRAHGCYPLPNLQPVQCGMLRGDERDLPSSETMAGSWAVSFGMPSRDPSEWREDVRQTRSALAADKRLSVSVVGTVQDGWSLDQLADDYAQCAAWAVESGADCIETNFSCPNVSTCDGQLYQHPDQAVVVAARVREAIGRVPFIAKIGRVPRDEDAARLVENLDGLVDALAMTNSIASTVVEPSGGRLFGGQPRGICGDATREASLAQTRMLAQRIQQQHATIQLIGVGGAATAEHVRQYLAAGAHAVHLATSAMVDPGVALAIRRQWADDS